MQAEIITIGDEILIGQIIDTNSAFIGKALNSIGVSVYQITSIQDEKDHLIKAFKEAEENADIIIVTGGLGPTKDDITKHTLAEYFNDTLVQNDLVLAHVEQLFEKYITTPISDLNRKQALVPSKSKVLMNKYGTAPGIWMEKGDKVFISLPGVPYEMKALVEDEVLPKLVRKYKRPYILHKTILTYGLGESAIAQRIEHIEDQLPKHIKLAYLPSLGRVRLRLSGKGNDEDVLNKDIQTQVENILPLIKDIFVGFEDNNNSIEQIIANQLVKTNQTLAIAESCTGGKLTQTFTQHSGASAYFKGGLVTYATQSKVDILGVDQAIIEKHSVVSEAVAKAMAINVREKLNADIGISTTGNAGPTKGDSDAEVGTVFIGFATKEGAKAFQFNMGNHRERVINKTVNKVLELLQKEIFEN
ncbi:nicotinamide-nucleotide amidase [Mesoflavibacter sabulilitoris]|uniref:CinA-like protein n=1 Tax=Mesoflavibacter zeaxanthinifaciens subsp. sabulilitoris TaxID=1520893 RepID=A0A2T1NAV3_9FLAO|nr:competence/damage-inducible protein A [Mesoflavibacter zeaxanthinifaciens]MBB3123595.1 nicotinamide-nucleotide amidase [Mesoflavibacter zeaxanthinifaciens subsp. sabulilitoris]PSG89276.1 competence/damage-inducible protein A [Mesoflavibacter zeaxanthinifaciens subsp. sabulilitoris]